MYNLSSHKMFSFSCNLSLTASAVGYKESCSGGPGVICISLKMHAYAKKHLCNVDYLLCIHRAAVIHAWQVSTAVTFPIERSELKFINTWATFATRQLLFCQRWLIISWHTTVFSLDLSHNWHNISLGIFLVTEGPVKFYIYIYIYTTLTKVIISIQLFYLHFWSATF